MIYCRFSNVLTVEPLAGLCNRIRVIDAALAFAKKLNKPLRILWYNNQFLNCPFNRLFYIPEDIAEFKQIDYFSPLAPLRYKLSRYVYPFIYSGYINRRTSNRLLAEKSDYMQYQNMPSLKITTCHRFHVGELGYKYFKPVAAIDDMVDACTRHFRTHTVGIHIRRTDHVSSIATSKSNDFVRSMRQCIHEQPDCQFFLATDSFEEERRLIEMFPERIICHQKRSLERNCPEAIEDALVDLMCLAKTKRIIGSFASSFSETAAEIGKIKLSIAQSS